MMLMVVMVVMIRVAVKMVVVAVMMVVVVAVMAVVAVVRARVWWDRVGFFVPKPATTVIIILYPAY